MKFKNYLKEIELLKYYILVLFLCTISFFSVYSFLDIDLVYTITDEDHLYEWLTVVFFIVAAILSFILYRKFRNIFFIIFFLMFIFAAGEEISWGQRILGFEAPEKIKALNVQDEFTLHNLELFNSIDHDKQEKTGIARLLEINFMFRIGTLLFGILLPLLVYHIRFFKKLTRAIKIPVPPVSIGVFFFVSWWTFRMLHTSFPVIKNGGDEIYESLAALVFMLIFIWFYKARNEFDYLGIDLKESFNSSPSVRKIGSLSKTKYYAD